MEFHYWNVLVVDDDADVHAVTRLALKRMEVYGLPVKLHEAKSKAEAIQWFKTSPDARHVHAALIDVVMDSDVAGLELCAFIRNELGDANLPLVLRTGQAGKAPEREVVNTYDITSYISKTEATEDKLYSVVKCCLKAAYVAHMFGRVGRMVTLVEAKMKTRPEANPRERLKGILREFFGGLSAVPSLGGDAFSVAAIWGDDDDHVGVGAFADRQATLEVRDRMVAQTLTTVDEFGSQLGVHEDPRGRGLPHPLHTGIFATPAVPGVLPKQQVLWLTHSKTVPAFEVDARRAHYLTMRLMYAFASRLAAQ